MLRFEVSEAGQGALPAVDIADEVIVLGSGAAARLRLPAGIARESHVRFEGGQWIAIGEVIVDGTPRKAGEAGALGTAARVFELGTYRVRVSVAPDGIAASPPQRTESIARELVRAMLGAGAAPALQIAQGPLAGATRELPPPEATIVIGRGDDADWVILDEDLSRLHAEVRRGWDGVTIRDRGSKNGTRVDGAPAAPTGTLLRDGCTVTMGNIVLRFRDPAERHLLGEPAALPPAPPSPAAAATTSTRIPPAAPPQVSEPRGSVVVLIASSTVCVLALAALGYLLAS